VKTNGVILMGVAGSGKTTVGEALAGRLGWEYFDADSYHPPANVAKMAAGIPLTDADRAPWLAALHDLLEGSLRSGRHPVLACSALKESYRERLLDGSAGVTLVFLKGSYKLIRARLAIREDHYMKPEMLRSQFDALEEPRNALTVDIARTPAEIVDELCQAFAADEETKAAR
jgi:gluconokinase